MIKPALERLEARGGMEAREDSESKTYAAQTHCAAPAPCAGSDPQMVDMKAAVQSPTKLVATLGPVGSLNL